MIPIGKSRGFTLIELIITVMIIGILAAIAIPSYVDYVTRGKIAEAKGSLSAMRVSAEQFFQDNRTYVGMCGTISPADSPERNFTYTCPTQSPTAYLLQADGKPSRSMSGFTYTIDNQNVRKTTSAWGGVTSDSCWVTTRDGSC